MSYTQVALLGLMGICSIFMVLNWWGLMDAIAYKKGYSFAPPYLCGVIASIAMLAYPGGLLKSYAWVPLLVDPSIAFTMGWLGVQKIFGRNK